MPNYLQNYNTKKRVGYLPFYEGSITGIRPGKKFYPEIVCGIIDIYIYMYIYIYILI